MSSCVGDVADLKTESSIRVRRLYLLATGLFVAGLFALLIDVPVARFCRDGHVPGDLGKLLVLSEVFGHGIGVALIGLTVIVLNRERRRAMFRVLTCAYGTGILANGVKLMVARVRPRDFDLDTAVLATFHGWVPVLSSGRLDSRVQAFPSGHTATAVGLAIGLAWLYPHGRWLFVFLATLVALQRVEAGAHYVSDTLFGAGLACVFASLCLGTGLLGRWFDRWENPQWKKGSGVGC